MADNCRKTDGHQSHRVIDAKGPRHPYRRDHALENVNDQDRGARAFAQHAKGIGRAHILGAMLADVNAFEQAAENICRRDGADDISDRRAKDEQQDLREFH